jgi:diketogulonate reductase-like aldo/keto reductase
MSSTNKTTAGKATPSFLYGTAWKEERTGPLVELALACGFRGFDTANQRRHYLESAVGEALAAATQRGMVGREELFLQSKFTFPGGQDHRLPYDPQADLPTQVEQSFASSLEHLKVTALDSYLLHGPSQRAGLGVADWQVWRVMEQIQARGSTCWIGVSNVSLDQLDQLCQGARIQPTFVQNRCYASTGWDRQVRTYCAEHAILYQGFSLLTANRHILAHPALVRIGRLYDRSTSQIVFRFALEMGIIPLTGTSSAEHMRADLAVLDFSLQPEEVELIETVGMR